MKKLVIAFALLVTVIATLSALNGCGKNDASTTKFTITGAGQ